MRRLKGNDEEGGGAGSLGRSGSTREISRVGDHGGKNRDRWPEVLEELAGRCLKAFETIQNISRERVAGQALTMMLMLLGKQDCLIQMK